MPELCLQLGISSAPFYKWRAKYGGMDVSLMTGMKELEVEKARPRKMCERVVAALMEFPRNCR